MADEAFLDEVGLGQLSMMQTQGAACCEKFSLVLDTLKPSNKKVNAETKEQMAKQLSTWIYIIMPDKKKEVYEPEIARILDLVGELTVIEDPEAVNSSNEYIGSTMIANSLMDMLSNYTVMDFTGTLARQHCVHAFTVLEKILETPNLKYTQKMPLQNSESNSDFRAMICSKLVRLTPNQGDFSLPNGMKVISLLLTPKNKFPTMLLNDTRSTLSVLSSFAKSSIAHSGRELMEIVKAGGNDQLLMTYMTMPELYTNCPEAVHENIAIFMKQPYMQYASVFMNISSRAPEVLITHLQFFIDQLTATAMVGTVTLMILENLAKHDPPVVYAKIQVIIEKSASVQNGGIMLAKVFTQVGMASAAAADEMLLATVELLERSKNDQYAPVGCLSTISNLMPQLSSREVLLKQMPRIAKFKTASEVIFTSIDDFASGRSLETLTNRVDEMEAKISQMNTKIAETCTSMADVIAYVDANMADMKDFLADVVKKLPNPKRLEVVGTFRKTLLLHFECCHTGYEYPIVSHEWSKWLKMGFSLVKAGKAVIDIGMGNPLGLLNTGITAVQEIYEAYKTNDDDEFQTYITQPFLTSAEQDQLINKLRDQNFFEIFAYDAQMAGWYLLNPEKDGHAPDGEAGSVTKVRSKKGYGGITETIVEVGTSIAMNYISNEGNLGKMEVADTILSGENAVTFSSGGNSKKEERDSMNPIVRSSSASGKGSEMEMKTNSSSSPSKVTGSTSGGRAQAMKEKFKPETVALAEATVQESSRTAQYYAKVDEYEKRIQQLETKVADLQSSVEILRNQKASCACAIM